MTNEKGAPVQLQKVNILQQLQATEPTKIVLLPEVADRFKNLYITFNGKDGARFYEAEKFHFQKILQDNPKLAACTKLSLYGCFLDNAVNGLSFDPALKHLYIIPRAFKVSRRNEAGIMQESWEQRACIEIAGQGELIMRMQQGQIKYADNPVLVYEGDYFKYGSRNNAVFVEHEVTLPRKSENIIACYLKITRADDTIDYKILSEPEVQKFRDFSKDKNSLAWTSGFPGMVQTKTIKHAFRGYPKIRILDKTQFTNLASENIEQEEEEKIDIYGLGPAAHQEITPHTEVKESQPLAEDFDKPAPVTGKGKTFEEDNF